MKETKQDLRDRLQEAVRAHYRQTGGSPSVRELAAAVGRSPATVHRHLVAMREAGTLTYCGRRAIGGDGMQPAAPQRAMPVLGFVACGPGQEEEEQVLDYIRLPQRLVGSGDLFCLIAKGESMIDAGIRPGDYVIVRRQPTANDGDLVVALSSGKNNLKQLRFDLPNHRYVLRSCNGDKQTYPDIIVHDLRVQGVVVGSYHAF